MKFMAGQLKSGLSHLERLWRPWAHVGVFLLQMGPVTQALRLGCTKRTPAQQVSNFWQNWRDRAAGWRAATAWGQTGSCGVLRCMHSLLCLRHRHVFSCKTSSGK